MKEIINVDTLTSEIVELKQQTANNIIEIGKRLKLVKESLPHGEWLPWLKEKVDFAPNTAQRFIQISTEFPNTPTSEYLPVSKIFELLGLPKQKRAEFLAKHDIDKMPVKKIRQAVKEFKRPQIVDVMPEQKTVIPLAMPQHLPDERYTEQLIVAVQDGDISYDDAAKIADKAPHDEQEQHDLIFKTQQAGYEKVADLPPEDKEQTLIKRNRYQDGKGHTVYIYLAQIDDKYYLDEIAYWNTNNNLAERTSSNYTVAFDSLAEANEYGCKVWSKMHPDRPLGESKTDCTFCKYITDQMRQDIAIAMPVPSAEVNFDDMDICSEEMVYKVQCNFIQFLTKEKARQCIGTQLNDLILITLFEQVQAELLQTSLGAIKAKVEEKWKIVHNH